MNRYQKINQYTTLLHIFGNTRTGVIAVDTDDVAKLSQHSWYIAIASHCYTKGGKKIIAQHNYVRAKINGKSEKIHRFILKVIGKKCIVDHIDKNTFNNKKNNLRVVTSSKNILNSRVSKNNTSGFTGVYYISKKETWVASIKINYKTIIKTFSVKKYGSTAKLKAIEARKTLFKTFNDQP